VALLLLKDRVSDALKSYQEAARALKLDLRGIEIRIDRPDLPTAFDAAVKERVNAMIPIRNGTIIVSSRASPNSPLKIGYRPCSNESAQSNTVG
jgi:hypothetical protein